LPATIFNHYFGKRPCNKDEYKSFLTSLKDNGIFLIDIIDEPLRIRDRNSPKQIHLQNYKYLVSCIPKLKAKILKLNIDIEEEKITFLLARQHYKSELRNEFPKSRLISWKDFRMNKKLLEV